VLHFDIQEGYKKPVIKAMIQLEIDGASDKQIVWAELTSKESEAVIDLARSVEYRLQSGESLSSKQELPRSHEKESLYKHVSKRWNNLFMLQEQAANYPAGEIPVELQNRIANEDQAIADLEDRLRTLLKDV
jgi:hypothetical protein